MEVGQGRQPLFEVSDAERFLNAARSASNSTLFAVMTEEGTVSGQAGDVSSVLRDAVKMSRGGGWNLVLGDQRFPIRVGLAEVPDEIELTFVDGQSLVVDLTEGGLVLARTLSQRFEGSARLPGQMIRVRTGTMEGATDWDGFPDLVYELVNDDGTVEGTSWSIDTAEPPDSYRVTVYLDGEGFIFDFADGSHFFFDDLRSTYRSGNVEASSPPAETPDESASSARPGEPDDVRLLKSALAVVDEPNADALGVLVASTEALLSRVRHHLLEGTWSPENGYEFGLEQDIERDVAELERQMRPLSGRPPNMTMVQGYVTQLSGALLEVAQREASEESRAHLERLRSDVLDRMSGFDGTTQDIGEAVETLEALAFETAWAEVEPPGTASEEDWDEFTSYAAKYPNRVAEAIVGWRPINQQEKAGVVLDAMSAAGGIGFFAQSVAIWAGAAGATVGGVSVVVGLIGAMVGAILGVLATRFVSTNPDDDRQP